MLTAALLLQTAPTATFAEPEITVPDLAARYSAAVGEPVEVPANVKDRAVAIFARNEPWPKLLALAGEAAAFRLVRDGGRLRLESTRPLTVAALEADRNARLRARAALPEDLAAATDRFRAAFRQANARRPPPVKGKPPRPLALSAGCLWNGNVLTVGSVVLGRSLAKGGRLTLADTTELPIAAYLDAVSLRDAGWLNEETERITTAEQARRSSDPGPYASRFDLYDPRAALVAARMNLETVDVGTYLGGGLGSSWELFSLFPVSDPDRPAFDAFDAAHPLDPKLLTPSFPRSGGLAVGDLLRALHARDGALCAAPALRIALDPALASAYRAGFRLAARGNAVVATSEFGEGFWPRDLALLDRPKRPTLSDYVRTAGAMERSARAFLLGFRRSLLSMNDARPLGPCGPFLRFLHRADPRDLNRLLSGERLAARTMAPSTATALLACVREDRLPDPSLRSLGPEDDALVSREPGGEPTYTLRYSIAGRTVSHSLRLSTSEIRSGDYD